jgi:hypothetical protein
MAIIKHSVSPQRSAVVFASLPRYPRGLEYVPQSPMFFKYYDAVLEVSML